MKYRKLGKTDLLVSEIGHGTFGMGHLWKDAEDATSLEALRLSFEEGVNFYDTALHYGYGRAEKLVGRLAKDVGREKVFIATKVLPLNEVWPAPCGMSVEKVFPRDHIRKCAEESLRNLQTDFIDLLQLHVWQDHWLETPDFIEELELLRKEGKVRFLGVSINDHDPTSALLLPQSERFEVIQVIYNIFDPSPDEALLDLCQERNIGVIARCPFDEGGLTGEVKMKTEFHPEDFRSMYFQGNRKSQIEAKLELLSSCLGEEARTFSELALRFCLSNSQISTVIPGMRSRKHVLANTAVSDGRALTKDLLMTLSRFAWPRNFYGA